MAAPSGFHYSLPRITHSWGFIQTREGGRGRGGPREKSIFSASLRARASREQAFQGPSSWWPRLWVPEKEQHCPSVSAFLRLTSLHPPPPTPRC